MHGSLHRQRRWDAGQLSIVTSCCALQIREREGGRERERESELWATHKGHTAKIFPNILVLRGPDVCLGGSSATLAQGKNLETATNRVWYSQKQQGKGHTSHTHAPHSLPPPPDAVGVAHTEKYKTR